MNRPKGAPRGLYESPRSPRKTVGKRTWGRRNLYVCDTCHKAVATEDVDEGATPMFLACRVEGEPSPDKCQGTMQSQMYPAEPWPKRFKAMIAGAVGRGGAVERIEVAVEVPPVTYEWFRPEGRAYRKLSPEMKDHVDSGGLDLRAKEPPNERST